MKQWLMGTISLALIGLFILGCTATQQGAGIGAGVGAIAGQAIGHSTGATLIGAGMGGVAGALVGDSIETDKRKQAEATGYTEPPRQAARVAPGSYQTDPTLGEFANKTRWEVNVWIDSDPNRAQSNPSVVLRPSESLPTNLDVGQHRIYAVGYVDTQYGRRLAGRFDRIINVDVRGNGWYVEFTPAVFN